MPTESVAIVIPSRFDSTRFPGKPLAGLFGGSLLSHTIMRGREAASLLSERYDVDLVVATDDERIAEHVVSLDCDVAVQMTRADCTSGTDRVLDAVLAIGSQPDIVVNLQGDAPLTPPEDVAATVELFSSGDEVEIATAVAPLLWTELDQLRTHKNRSPFSGTTAVVDPTGRARWFSKQILPTIRNEADARVVGNPSPVLMHLGLYAYRLDALTQAVALPVGRYEALEGLEQLRWLEGGMTIHAVTLSSGNASRHTGVDTPADLEKARQWLEGAKGSSL